MRLEWISGRFVNVRCYLCWIFFNNVIFHSESEEDAGGGRFQMQNIKTEGPHLNVVCHLG